MNPKVSTIILNWNGWEDTLECLESLYQITYPNYDVIVVDNGSEDESIEKIKEYAEGKIEVESKFFEYDPSNKPIKIIEYIRKEAEDGGGKEKGIDDLPSTRRLIIIRNEKNYGFAEGNNIGMRYVLKALNPDYVLLLNNDTVVDREFLTELVKVAESGERIGIVGPKIYYYDYNGRKDVIWFAGAKISWWRWNVYYHIGKDEHDSGQYNQIREVDLVSGATLMLKHTTIEQLSLLNTDYFLGYEDIEYCMRAWNCGIEIIYIPNSKVWHKIGVSRIKRDQFMDISSYFKFIKKNFSKFVFIYHFILFFTVTLIKWGITYLIKYRDKKKLSRFISELRKLVGKGKL